MKADELKVVYVSNLGLHNYAPAARFGSIVPLTNGNYPVFKTQQLAAEITKGLMTSTPEDFLLLSGSSIIAGMSLAIWLTIHPKCNLLLYDRRTEEYVPRTITQKELNIIVEQARDEKAVARHEG